MVFHLSCCTWDSLPLKKKGPLLTRFPTLPQVLPFMYVDADDWLRVTMLKPLYASLNREVILFTMFTTCFYFVNIKKAVT